MEDGFNKEICKYDCYMGKDMEHCVDWNLYEDERCRRRRRGGRSRR